jgi:tRNA nucleotidyltransferase (CCA-adding enzyme)
MQIYLVGGAVRNALLQLPVQERDWVVVGSSEVEMLALGYLKVGKDFPVFLHPTSKEEYALARLERKTAAGYHGFTCIASPSVTLEEDLQRRDLTINAIAQTADGQLIDPYGGVADMQAKILRHVSPAFSEDPLRVLRVARFAASFYALGFRIADSTMQLMHSMCINGELHSLTPTRVWLEVEKALATQHPLIFFKTLHILGALKIVLPELANIWQYPQKIARLEQSLAMICQITTTLPARFATLCFPLSLQQLKTWQTRAVLPSAYCHLAILSKRCLPMLPKTITAFTAESILSVLQTCDAWRRPHLLQQTLLVAAAEAQLPIGEYQPAQLLQACLLACQNIQITPWVEQGLDGAAIGKAMQQARLTAITKIQAQYYEG